MKSNDLSMTQHALHTQSHGLPASTRIGMPIRQFFTTVILSINLVKHSDKLLIKSHNLSIKSHDFPIKLHGFSIKSHKLPRLEIFSTQIQLICENDQSMTIIMQSLELLRHCRYQHHRSYLCITKLHIKLHSSK